MKIIYDARLTLIDRQDGISRYGACLLAALVKQHPVTMLIYDLRQLQFLPQDVPYVLVSSPYSALDILLPLKLNKLKPDVVFSPFLSMGLGNFGRKYKVILTTHDLIYYNDPTPSAYLPPLVKFFSKIYSRWHWPQRFLLNRADYVVTISQVSKNLIEKYQLTKRPIGIVYNAPSNLPKIELKQSIKQELVYMGVLKPYKNVELLLQALALLPGYTLHLLSRVSDDRQAELQKLITRPAQVVFWNGASDQQYAELLSTASALVSASKDEGFGLPLVEAMSVGTPVICSDIPIFHEVAGEAAIFFNQDSPEDFASCVKSLESPELRAHYIQKGLDRVKRFSWDDSARELLQIMNQLVTKL